MFLKGTFAADPERIFATEIFREFVENSRCSNPKDNLVRITCAAFQKDPSHFGMVIYGNIGDASMFLLWSGDRGTVFFLGKLKKTMREQTFFSVTQPYWYSLGFKFMKLVNVGREL